MNKNQTSAAGDGGSGGGRPPIWAVLAGVGLVLGAITAMQVLGFDVASIAGVLTAAAVIVATVYKLVTLPPRRSTRRRVEPTDPEPTDPDEEERPAA